MKRFLIPVLILAVAVSAFPQNKKGNLLIGTYVGSTGLSFGSSESGSSGSENRSKSESTSFSLGIGPSIGYFLTDNLVVGSSLSISYGSYGSEGSYTKSDATSESNSSSLYVSIGPFVRYYFGDNNPRKMPYIHAYVGTSLYPIYSGHYENSGGTEYDYSYEKYSAFSGGIQLGMERFLNPAIGLQYYIGYSFSHSSYEYEYDYEDGAEYSSDYKSTSHGLSVGIGIQIHLDWLNRNK